jgi:hypothetical protein
VIDEESGNEWRGVINGCLVLLKLKKGSLETLLFLKERARAATYCDDDVITEGEVDLRKVDPYARASHYRCNPLQKI